MYADNLAVTVSAKSPNAIVKAMNGLLKAYQKCCNRWKLKTHPNKSEAIFFTGGDWWLLTSVVLLLFSFLCFSCKTCEIKSWALKTISQVLLNVCKLFRCHCCYCVRCLLCKTTGGLCGQQRCTLRQRSILPGVSICLCLCQTNLVTQFVLCVCDTKECVCVFFLLEDACVDINLSINSW